MPNTNDSFTTTLKQAHLEWGSHRHTSTRGTIYGEGYLQIPRPIARSLSIHNTNQNVISEIYSCTPLNGNTEIFEIKAAGSENSEDILAKQFQGNNNLKTIGSWFYSVNAQIDDEVEIIWTSPSCLTIRKL